MGERVIRVFFFGLSASLFFGLSASLFFGLSASFFWLCMAPTMFSRKSLGNMCLYFLGYLRLFLAVIWYLLHFLANHWVISLFCVLSASVSL